MPTMLNQFGDCGIVPAGCSLYPRWGMPAARGGARFALTVHRRHVLLVDAAVTVLVGVVIVTGTLLHGDASARPLPLILGTAAAASLIGRRRAPGWTLAASAVLVLVLFHVDHSAGAVAVIAPAVALYSLALNRGRTQQVLAAIAAVAAVALADVLHSGRPTIVQTLGHVLLVAIPLLAAEAIRTHRSYLAVVLERLELSERAREQAAERRAEQERMRIARELHDVVAHTLTEINVQAAAAAELAPPGSERLALEKIEHSSHTAIGELRAILGVLREPDSPGAPRAPATGVQDIPELVERARDAGLQIELDVGGTQPGHVDDAVSLAAYRIVQEALTNARRHAAGAPVSVRLGFGSGELSVAVNNGAGRSQNGHAGGPGVGITGMLERAAAVGGTLRAGPSRDGFEVAAELPYELDR